MKLEDNESIFLINIKEGYARFKFKPNYQIKELLDVLLGENGEKKLGIRERTHEEIENGEYIPSQECLEEIEKIKKELGYVNGKHTKLINSIVTYAHRTHLEHLCCKRMRKEIKEKRMLNQSIVKDVKEKYWLHFSLNQVQELD